MKNKTSNTIISFALTLSLLLPLGIGFSHAFNNHEHSICNAKTEKHLHSKKVVCSYLHYFANLQSLNQDSDFSTFIPYITYSKQINLKSIYFFIKTSSYLVRGPPTFNVF